MGFKGRSQEFIFAFPTAIVLLATLRLQMVRGGRNSSGGSSSSEDLPKPRFQRKAAAMMQTSTVLASAPTLAGAYPRQLPDKAHAGSKQRHTDMEDALNMGMSSPRMLDPFFGLEDAFDEENAVEAAALRTVSAPAVSAEWFSFLWMVCIDAVMGGIGAASFLYLRTYLSFRPKESVPAKDAVKPKARHDGEAASAATATLRNNSCDDWGCSALHLLAAAGDWEAAKALLQQQCVDVDAREAWEETPLHLAARAGHVELCKLLLGHGADIDATGLDGETPLVVAARSGHEAVCQVLLLHGAGCAGLREDELPELLIKMIVARMLPQED